MPLPALPALPAIAELRKSYERAALDEAASDADPLAQFERWLHEAIAAQLPEPNAMTLATVGGDLRPATRIVLVKGYGPDGIVWYTNYDSRKGHELATNPRVAGVFHWDALSRQVRFEGRVVRCPAQESDEYFASRALDSRIGAWASLQSQPLDSRTTLLKRVAIEAARIALKYRTPVYLLSDAYLANGSEPWLVPNAADLPDIAPVFATEPNDGDRYLPYVRDQRTLAREWAVPGTPGIGLATIGYNTSVSAGGDRTFFRGGRFVAGLDADVTIDIINPSYTFATPVFGGRFSLSMLAIVGRSHSSIDASLTGPRGNTISGSASSTITSAGSAARLQKFSAASW